MRAAILFVSALLLAACKDEPRFDDRYDEAAKEIEARANAMDADIAKSGQAAPAASNDLSETAKPSNPPPSSGE
ncbi:hypothetical protein [Sphingopyxis sp. H115]|uniref:hypothetical protein n=1 Tax=Sphingopyxis sp. H115 TaxID=1759073 RepID=UPI000737754F|nr:hypothetical protein [Sphingopyxis sp. H115]KTE17765.1 hypothetical protein ATE71_01305 [Sphingopyxis sp. H115]